MASTLLSRCLLVVVTAFFGFAATAVAEPWLGNRYAQNCAGCHSPSRRNVPLVKRRCSLSCQGCHVNPNGGGLRNQYGVWLEERWLRSFVVKGVGERNVAPLPKQVYAKQPKEGFRGKKPSGYTDKGPKLTITSAYPPEKAFDKSDKEWSVLMKRESDFMDRVTTSDPLRIEREQRLTGGGDLRYVTVLDQTADIPDEQKENSWLMGVDVGLRARPMRRYVSAVVEARWLQGPRHPPSAIFASKADTRSAYLLVDDLPFNVFTMYGYYRPNFGNYNPDHTALAQKQSGLGQRSRFKAVTLGAAPNVPFFNVHMIEPSPGEGTDKSRGFAYNLGMRFVSFGLSAVASGWLTKDEDSRLRKQLYSYDLGAYVWRVSMKLEILNFRNEIEPERFAQGNVTTAELKTRFWRENYLITNYARSNLSYSYQPGSVAETMLGVKSFPISGTELELLYVTRDVATEPQDGTPKAETARKALQSQVHVFF